MTIEEAINILKKYINYDNPYVPDFYTMEEAIKVIIEALEQEPCEDAVSRQAVLDLPRIKTHNVWGNVICESVDVDNVRQLPSVTPQPEVGRWIYDKNIDNWKCSECGETPKTMGYCGSADFMAKHFKYCNHCGAKMQEVEE